MRDRSAARVLVLAPLALAALAAAQAPAPPPAPLVVFSVIDVEPALLAEFGELQAEVMAAQRKGGLPWRETWNVATFGRPYRVSVLAPLAGFGELDGQSYTARGAGAEAARLINERARRMIVGQQIYALRLRPDLGYGTRPPKLNLAVLTTLTVAPGRGADYEALVRKEVVPAYKRAGEPYLGMAQVVLGGNPSQYFALTLYDDHASLQKGNPILRALGQEAFAAFRRRIDGVVMHEQHELLRFNPALSFQAAAR